jgi:transposase-like protein
MPMVKRKDVTLHGRSRRRPLRGEALVRAAMVTLGEMVHLSPRTDPINVLSLARRLGVSRQAIYDNGLKPAVDEHAALQRANFSTSVEAASQRRPLEQRVAALEQEKRELQQALDGWIERWVTVEYNARMHNYDADQLFAPMPPPARKTLAFRRGKKKG